jgi:hypothetical protein
MRILIFICLILFPNLNSEIRASDFHGPRVDFHGDGLVDGADLAVLLYSWGSWHACADLTGDGVVDGADLAIFLDSWGSFSARNDRGDEQVWTVPPEKNPYWTESPWDGHIRLCWDEGCIDQLGDFESCE